MEPYKAYGRGGYNRNTQGCNSQRNMNGYMPGRACQGGQEKNVNKNTNSSCGCSSSPRNDCGCKHTHSDEAHCNRAPESDCDCKDENKHMRHMPVGIGYVPMQQWCSLYDPETALCQGTAFPELNLIFCGSRGKL